MTGGENKVQAMVESVPDPLSEQYQYFDSPTNRQIWDLFAILTPQEIAVIARYYEGKTQTEIASELKLNQPRISNIFRNIRNKHKDLLTMAKETKNTIRQIAAYLSDITAIKSDEAAYLSQIEGKLKELYTTLHCSDCQYMAGGGYCVRLMIAGKTNGSKACKYFRVKE